MMFFRTVPMTRLEVRNVAIAMVHMAYAMNGGDCPICTKQNKPPSPPSITDDDGRIVCGTRRC
jgi:hypothetical protein